MDNNILEILIFNVGQAQSIFFYPRNNPEYSMLIDCAESDEFRPIDFLIKNNFIFWNVTDQRYELSNLTITNYDHDHFSSLPKIREKVHIKTVKLPKNISSKDLREIKPEITEGLNHLCYLKDTYIYDAYNHVPPYRYFSYSLEQSDFEDDEIDTNKLGQIVFVEYGGSRICISGDLINLAWEKILQKPEVRYHLKNTNIFVAAHHGHEDGYHEDIFLYCTNPECIVISDKDIAYNTQDGMANKYTQHVLTGISLNNSNPKRKVLTTRSDGHIWIRFDIYGNRSYKNFSIS